MDYQETTLETLEERMENLENHIIQLKSWQTVTQQETLTKLEENQQQVMALLLSLFDHQVGSASTFEDTSSDHTQEYTLFVITISHPEKESDFIEGKVFKESHGEYLKMLGKSTTLMNIQNQLLWHVDDKIEWHYDDKVDVYFVNNSTCEEGSFGLLKYGEEWFMLIESALRILRNDQMLQDHQVFENCSKPNKSNVVLILETPKNDMSYCMELNVDFDEGKGGTKLQIKGFVVVISLFLCNKKWCLIRDKGGELVMEMNATNPRDLKKRSPVLLRFLDLVDKHNEKLATLETGNKGKAFGWSFKFELRMLASLFATMQVGQHKYTSLQFQEMVATLSRHCMNLFVPLEIINEFFAVIYLKLNYDAVVQFCRIDP